MAPGLISEFKQFSFPTPSSFLTFKAKKERKNKSKIRKDFWHPPTSSSRPSIGQESSESMKFQE